MRVLLTVLVTALVTFSGLMASAEASEKVIVLGFEPGGNLSEHIKRFEYYKSTGAEVQLTNTTASSGTIFLGLPRVCVKKNIPFYFHGPMGKGGKKLSASQFERASQRMADKYPSALRKMWFKKLRHVHGLENYQIISSNELVEMGAARFCK